MKSTLKPVTLLLITLAMNACTKSDLPGDYPIEGIYAGAITRQNSGKSATGLKNTSETIAMVSRVGSSLIEVHMYNTELDTVFRLNIYDNMDQVMVCEQGADFEAAYGHAQNTDHNGEGMMSDMQRNQTEWMHHLADEHQEEDNHSGMFSKEMHSFSYSFSQSHSGVKEMYLFEGRRQ